MLTQLEEPNPSLLTMKRELVVVQNDVLEKRPMSFRARREHLVGVAWMDNEVSTVGGYVVLKFGHQLRLDSYTVTVEQPDGRDQIQNFGNSALYDFINR